MEKVVKQPFRCVICHRVCSNIDFMKTHMVSHGYEFPCDVCAYVFLTKEAYDKHMTLCKNDIMKDYKSQLKKKRKNHDVDENHVINCCNPFLKQDYSIWDFGFML